MKLHTRCALIAALWLVGCTTAPPSPTRTPPPTDTPAPTATPTRAAPLDAPGRGQILFSTMRVEVGFACATCHYWNAETRLIGPGLRGVSQRAPDYNPEASVEAYLRQSILEPDAFIAPGQPPFLPGLMPRTYGSVFTEDELADLIAYLLTL